ncbi:hypothetical protein EVAR_10294_1 [Eumeta japonica]|uniref:ATP-dependent DNA helicase n=1 Tax=Eumeta variegata TaxID=151549 RepID=A0A4C1TDV0_EUMVA|nr:hypothetical protein EVAR_10294_1 [Eumeta japonica]
MIGIWIQLLKRQHCQTPHMIRELFCYHFIVLPGFGPLISLEKIQRISEDFKKQLERQGDVDVEHSSDLIFNKCLSVLEDAVLSLGGRTVIHTLKEYELPQPITSIHFENREYVKETSYDTVALKDAVRKNEASLNDEQQEVYNKIITSVDANDGRIFFLDAPGGTGKTFLINLLLAKVRSIQGIALPVASSGIAATLLEGGRTAHAAFKLTLNLITAETPICNISKAILLKF